MGRSILTSFVSRQAGTAFGGRLELAPSVKELEEARRGGVSHYLLSYVAAYSNQIVLFISDPGKYVRYLTLTEPTVCECDLVRFCGAAGHLDMQRTAGARLERFWSWLSWVGGKCT